MVDVSSQSNKVNITVSSSGVSSNVSASGDTSHYYSEKAREWAISNRIVDGVDYSSKYYAGKSNQSALNAQSFAQSAQDSYNNFQQSVDGALSNIDSSAQGAIDEINNTKTDIITDIEFVADGEKKEIEELAENAKDDIKSTGFYMEDDKLYFINSKGEVEEFKSGGAGLQLFDTKISDHILEDNSAVGWSLQGSYVNGAVYPDFYTKCLEEYNEAITTEQVNGVTVKVNSNGHKFYDIADKTAIDEFYNSLGSAWFYGVDTENERIFLPRDKYFAVTGNVSVVGNGMTLGLTDGVNNYGAVGKNAEGSNGNVGSYVEAYGQLIGNQGDNTGATLTVNYNVGVTTDPTKSGIEGKLTANQDKYLYICVGNIVVNEEQIDVSQVLNQAVLRSSLVEVQTVIESYTNGTSWYRVWSDGWCEQGGVIQLPSPLTFLKPFKDANYTILHLSAYTTYSGNVCFPSYYPATKTAESITLRACNTAGYDGTTVTSWYACGYIR